MTLGFHRYAHLIFLERNRHISADKGKELNILRNTMRLVIQLNGMLVVT